MATCDCGHKCDVVVVATATMVFSVECKAVKNLLQSCDREYSTLRSANIWSTPQLSCLVRVPLWGGDLNSRSRAGAIFSGNVFSPSESFMVANGDSLLTDLFCHKWQLHVK